MKPILFSTPMVQAILNGTKTQTRRVVKCWATSEAHPSRQTAQWQFENKTCPYGKPGDILWVRESFGYTNAGDLRFKANAEAPEYDKPFTGWKPSIHMPFTACRLFLKIKSIRVERLQDITEADAKAEGVKQNDIGYYINYMQETHPQSFKSPAKSFASLWNLINNNWNENPFVWVIEFERTENLQYE